MTVKRTTGDCLANYDLNMNVFIDTRLHRYQIVSMPPTSIGNFIETHGSCRLIPSESSRGSSVSDTCS